MMRIIKFDSLLLPLLFLTILSCGVAQYCSPGTVQATCASVLIISASDAPKRTDVQSMLTGTGSFTKVDVLDVTSSTPTLAQLIAYDAVLVFRDGTAFSDAVLLGDRLASFHDQGGGVIVGILANNADSGKNLKGAFGTAAKGYTLLNYASGGYVSPADSLGSLLEPNSPLLTGVTSISGTQAFRSTATVVNGGVVVAKWNGGSKEPMILRGARGNRAIVELNLFPVSSSVNAIWLTRAGSLATLLRNALKYSRCMLCSPGTYSPSSGLPWVQCAAREACAVWLESGRV